MRAPGTEPELIRFEEQRHCLAYWDGYDSYPFESGKTHPVDAEWAPCLPPSEDA